MRGFFFKKVKIIVDNGEQFAYIRIVEEIDKQLTRGNRPRGDTKMTNIETKIVRFTISENDANYNPSGDTYEVTGYLFPNGALLVSSDNDVDAWYESVEEYAPNAMDTILETEITDETYTYTVTELAESIRASRASYGKTAVGPNALAVLRYLPRPAAA